MNQAYRSLVRPCPAAEKNDKKQMKRLTGLVYLDDAMVSVEAGLRKRARPSYQP